eukprot:GAHX01001096.1.p1 GENE.GAHX01001096.1~~GAHX01001096.1.p1  ORF type:complete len:410 (-),score=72.30 GAHX01001096.1:69-1298(-)
MFNDDNYFSSYGYSDIHRTMIEDDSRTGTYHRALVQNKHLVKDKIVIDIGCGTGILSYFALKAGAKLVYAFDNSDIIDRAAEIAKLNKIENVVFVKAKFEEVLFALLYSDRFAYTSEEKDEVQRLKGLFEKNFPIISKRNEKFMEKLSKENNACDIANKILDEKLKFSDVLLEQLKSLCINKADILISEWMGYGLLAERMLPTVLLARDSFLKDMKKGESMMFPSEADIYVSLIEDWYLFNDEIHWTDSVWGYNFSPLQVQNAQGRKVPRIESFNKRNLISSAEKVIGFDLRTMDVRDLEFLKAVKVKIHKSKDPENNKRFFHGVCCWFDVKFSDCHKNLILDTAPFVQQTHWAQTIYLFDNEGLVYNEDEFAEIEINNFNAFDNERNVCQDISVIVGNRPRVEGRFLL